MTGILKNSKEQTNQKAFSPVPTADSFPWKKVSNDNSEITDSTLNYKLEPPKMESKKKETLYSTYDSFLDDKRNTFLSESSYTFDTLNRTSYIEESEYEPVVENQMSIITNEPPKPQRYSMLSALAPLTKRASLENPKLTQDSIRYSDEESSLYNDYSYVSYESDYEAADENAQPILQNKLEAKVDETIDDNTSKSLEKKIEENNEKNKKDDVIQTYISDSENDDAIIEEDFSLRFQRDSVRESKDIVAEAVQQKLKEVNEKKEGEEKKEKFEKKEEENEKKVEKDEKKDDNNKELKKENDEEEMVEVNGDENKEVKKSKGQLEREKAAREAKEIEALKPSYVGQTNIMPVVNELTSSMVVDAEKDAAEKANESISNIKPQFVGNITIQPNVASLTNSMIKPPTQSIYVTSKEMASMGLNIDESSDNINPEGNNPPKKNKGKERSSSDEEFYSVKEGLKNLSFNDSDNDGDVEEDDEDIEDNPVRGDSRNISTLPITTTPENKSEFESKPLLTAPQIEPAPQNKPLLTAPQIEPAPQKKPLLTAPQIEPPKNMPNEQQAVPQYLLDTEKQYKVLDHPNPLIYSSYLEKLSTHGKFQRRLFRFDGLILTCLSQSRQKVPTNSNLFNYQPLFLKDGTEESFEFLNSIGRFYPNDPASPELINPLVATEKQGNEYGVPDLKSHQYYYPKWMLNIHDIESIQPLLSIQSINRNEEDINTILRANNQDQNENTFIITTNKISYILRASNNRDFNRWMYILNRMKETYIDLQEEAKNPKPTIERPKFKHLPPPPAYPPPPELLAKRYKNSQEYVQSKLGFTMTFPKSIENDMNKPLIAQICKDVRDPYYRRIALLKVWNVCFTDLLSIDTSVSINAIIVPINKQRPVEAPSLPQVPANNFTQAMNMNIPGSSGMGMGPNGMGMGPAGMSGIPMGLMSPPGMKSPDMGSMGPMSMKNPKMNNIGGVPMGLMSPEMGNQPKMNGMNGMPMGLMSPEMGNQPKMNGMNGMPMGLMSPEMGNKSKMKGMNGVPMGLMSPEMGNKPKMNGMNGMPMGMPYGLNTPMSSSMNTPGLMSPTSMKNGMNMNPTSSMGTPNLMSPNMGSAGMKGKPMGMMTNTPMGVSGLMSPDMEMKKKTQLGETNEMINRKESISSDIKPNIKELINYGSQSNNNNISDSEEEDRFYLPKKEDGTLKPFLGRNSVIGKTNSLLHFKKLSLMDVGGDFNSLYRALGNNNNEASSPSLKAKAQKLSSMDHFAQELEMLDKMNNKSQKGNMNSVGINSRQVNMTNIIPGMSKTQSMVQPEDSMIIEDIPLDFPIPPNPYDDDDTKGKNNMNGMNGINGMNGMNSINGMNGMNSMRGMNGMNEMGIQNINKMGKMDVLNNMNNMNNINNMNGMNGINRMNSLNSMNSMNSMNGMIGMNNMNGINRMNGIGMNDLNDMDEMNNMNIMNGMNGMNGMNMNGMNGGMAMNANQKQLIESKSIPQEKIQIPVDPELLHCLTAMLRIIHRLSGSCFREEQKSFESVPPPVPKWYYQFCVKSFPSFAKLTQTHVINYLECMEEKYAINGHQELPEEYLKIQESLESFIKATRAWERVVNDWKRDIIHRKHLNHKKINFEDDDSIMKVVRINDVLRVNLLLKDHIEENARKETYKLRKFFKPKRSSLK